MTSLYVRREYTPACFNLFCPVTALMTILQAKKKDCDDILLKLCKRSANLLSLMHV